MVSLSDFPKEGTLSEQVLFVLNFVVRAPSTHNSQPWLFRINGENLEIYADWKKKLPYGDKDGRDLAISVGACIEHAIIATKYFGMFKEVHVNHDITPDTQNPFAVIALHTSEGVDDTFHESILAITSRFNARGPFKPRSVSADLLRKVESTTEEGVQLSILTEKEKMQTFASLTGEGMRSAHDDKNFRGEIASWLRSNYSQRKDGIPGYAMLAGGLLSLCLPLIIKHFNMGSLLAKLNKKSITSSSGVLVFSSSDTPLAWVKVGMLFARVSLMLNSKGVYSSIYVASIEMPSTREKLEHFLSVNASPQFACSFGYPEIMLPPTPRFEPRERVLQ